MPNLETHVQKEPRKFFNKESLIDTLSENTYSWMAGGMIDAASGLDYQGVLVSRAYATGINTGFGAIYGKYRNFLYEKLKTTEKSAVTRKYFSDLLAFNTFHTPLYFLGICLATLLSEGKIDLNKAWKGTAYLAMASPAIGPTMGAYMDIFRKAFKLKSAPEKAGIKLEEKEKNELF